MLKSCLSATAAKLSAAATAVRKLRPKILEDGVADLDQGNLEDAPDSLTNLLASLQRCHVLLLAGAAEMATNEQLSSSCQVGGGGGV